MKTHKMPPDSVWSDQFNKSEIQLNLKGTGWKNLMSNCLEQTEIFKGSENKSNCCGSHDPNIVMNMRHKMIKEFPKNFPIPRGQTQTEAFKLLREEYHNRLLKHKEEKLVQTEIGKLRQILENHRLIIRKKLEETNQKTKVPATRAKLTKCCKKSTAGAVARKMDAWLGCSVQVFMDTIIPGKHVEMSTKSQHPKEEIPDLASSRKGSLIEDESEHENEYWEEDDGGKDELLRRFLGNDVEALESESRSDKEEEVKAEQVMEVPKRMRQSSISTDLRKKNLDNQNRKTKEKIEAFLSRLGERKIKQEKGAAAVTRGRMRRKILEKREKDEQTDEKLKRLMQEVKSSQKEAHKKLHEARTSIETENKFLLRMEERRKERMKRRKKFEERKLELEEEKQNVERQKEEEQKQKDEQEKRKRLEELKEKRRVEKEKKEDQRREKEKLRVNMGLAVAHHRVYLLRGYGLRPWVRLMRMRESQQQEAVQFFERRLKERTLSRWFASVREEAELKVKCAVAFYEGLLKRNCLTIWMEARKKTVRQSQVAADWYDFKMTEMSFKRWRQFTKAEQWEYRIQSDIALIHHQRKLKLKYLQKLRDYPILKRLEQAKENRKWKWRQKVKEILPDFEPVDISESF